MSKLEDLAFLDHPSAIMMVGVPGSGKSYIAKQLSEALHMPVLSSDYFRGVISGDENDQSVSKEAWQMVYDHAEEAIMRGQSVIVDGTHANGERRRQDAALYHIFGARTVSAVYVMTSLETALSRNQSRSRVVPDFVIKRMYRALEEDSPSPEDGFDHLVRLNND